MLIRLPIPPLGGKTSHWLKWEDLVADDFAGLLYNKLSSNQDKNTTDECERSAGSRRVSATLAGPSHTRESCSGTLAPTPLTSGLGHFTIPALISFNSASRKMSRKKCLRPEGMGSNVPLHLSTSRRKTPFRFCSLGIL